MIRNESMLQLILLMNLNDKKIYIYKFIIYYK